MDYSKNFTNGMLREFAIPYAEENLKRAFAIVLNGGNVVWEEGYDEVVDWLSDNKGKGLLLMGGCGLGKTLIATRIIPGLIKHYCQKWTTVCYPTTINKKLDYTLSTNSPLVLDDIGIEQEFTDYGNKRYAVREIVDEAERTGRLLVITTNLTTDELTEKYGVRTIDRLMGLTRLVVIEGESNRK